MKPLAGLALTTVSAVAFFALASCIESAKPATATATPAAVAPAPISKALPATAAKKVVVTDADFACIRKLKPVRGYYVGNVLGNVDASVKAAEASGTYPVGSIVQLVPTEAMVKHEAGYNAATNDWEFFELSVSKTSTTIHVRGSTDVVNRFGGNCLSCHAPAGPKFDMVCEQNHGCLPIPITPLMAKAIQNTDPRCEPVALPPEQIDALKQLQAMMSGAATPAPKPAQ